MIKAIFLILVLALAGCATLKAELEGINYPADTAILIGNVAYQINTAKCHKIKAIGEDGALDCYDSEDRRSASITPVSDWRRNLVKEKMGLEWASPEHQAFLFHMFHGGGMENMARAMASSAQQAYGTYTATKSLTDSLKKSREIELQNAQMKIKGVQAYASGGMPAWQAHQSNVIQWRLDNSRYFSTSVGRPALVPLYRASDCIGTVVMGKCEGTILQPGIQPYCAGSVINGRCVGSVILGE